MNQVGWGSISEVNYLSR